MEIPVLMMEDQIPVPHVILAIPRLVAVAQSVAVAHGVGVEAVAPEAVAAAVETVEALVQEVDNRAILFSCLYFYH